MDGNKVITIAFMSYKHGMYFAIAPANMFVVFITSEQSKHWLTFTSHATLNFANGLVYRHTVINCNNSGSTILLLMWEDWYCSPCVLHYRYHIIYERDPDVGIIMCVLMWRTVSALTRGLFLPLFPELWSNEGNKHQNNTRVSTETALHESIYISQFLTRHP